MTSPYTTKVNNVDLYDASHINNLQTDLLAWGQNVVRWGADPTGVANSAPAIQDAINAVAGTGGTVVFPPGDYKINSALTIPNNASPTRQYPFRMSGYGARIFTASAINLITHVPANLTEMGTMGYMSFIMEGMVLDGGAVGLIGLKLGATYGARIQDCHFINLATGLDILYGLKARIANCFTHTCTTYGFRARSLLGETTGATAAGSASNSVRFDGCRVYNAAGATAGFHLRSGNNYALVNCICEGLNPVTNVDFDGTTDSIGLVFSITDMHLENVPTNVHIKAAGHNKVTLERLIPPGSGILVDAQGSNPACTIVVRDMPNLSSSGLKFRQLAADSFRWSFENCGIYEHDDLTSNTFWDVTGSYGNPGAAGMRTYVKGLTVGQTRDMIVKAILTGSKAWDPASVAAAGNTTTTVTVTDAAVGDQVSVGFGLTLQGMILTGYVSAANTVTVVLYNPTAGAIDLGSSTLRATAIQQGS